MLFWHVFINIGCPRIIAGGRNSAAPAQLRRVFPRLDDDRGGAAAQCEYEALPLLGADEK